MTNSTGANFIPLRARITNAINTAASSTAAVKLILFSIFFILAAAAHSGSMAKWGLRDSRVRFGFEALIDGTAHKPFVYRQLLPSIAKAADAVSPDSIRKLLIDSMDPQKSYTRATAANLRGYEFQYRIVFLASFVALILGLFFLRSVALQYNTGRLESILAPAVFVLALPYLQTIGGYYYDSVELAFLSASVLLAQRGQVAMLLAMTGMATLNKETFIFFVPTLYPFLRDTLSRQVSLGVIFVAFLIAGAVNTYSKLLYIDNPGAAATFHLWDNVRAYVVPWSLKQTEITYGVPGPRGAFFLTIAVIAIVAIRGWQHAPSNLRMHLSIALIINAPLFLVFSATGELRNLSLLYVGFVGLIGFATRDNPQIRADGRAGGGTDDRRRLRPHRQ